MLNGVLAAVLTAVGCAGSPAGWAAQVGLYDLCPTISGLPNWARLVALARMRGKQNTYTQSDPCQPACELSKLKVRTQKTAISVYTILEQGSETADTIPCVDRNCDCLVAHGQEDTLSKM